jgi:hypothetical protein
VSKYYSYKNKNTSRKKGYSHIIVVLVLPLFLMIPRFESTFQKLYAGKNDVFSENTKIIKTSITEKTSKTDRVPVVDNREAMYEKI